MNLYLISQDINNDYDTYDSAVVAAESKEEARGIHPHEDFGSDGFDIDFDDWVRPIDAYKIKVELIGTTDKKKGVILSSYRAG